MKSPAIAMLWETFAHRRWLIFSLACDFAILSVLVHVLPAEWLALGAVKASGLLFVVWFFIGIAALFCPIDRRPRTGRQGYPARMFLYPISTVRLVTYPMLFGMITMALGWLAVASLILKPFGFRPQIALGTMGAATTMAMLQASCWWPFRTGVMRIVTFSTTLVALLILVLWPMMVWDVRTWFGWLLLAVYLVAAYGLSVKGVGLDRAGERDGDKEFTPFRDRFERFSEAVAGRSGRDQSASEALFWFEWRTKGIVIVVLSIAILVVVACSAIVPTFFVHIPSPMQGRFLLTTILIAPLYICWIMGSRFGLDDPARRSSIISPFIATRPTTTGRMAAIKLLAAASSLLVTYAILLLMTPLWAVALESLDFSTTTLKPVIAAKGAGAVVLIAVLGLVVILTTAWRGMIGTMLPILTGRRMVSNLPLGSTFALLTFVGILIVVAATRDQDQIIPRAGRVFRALPWIMAVAVAIKLVASAVTFHESRKRGLISGWLLPLAGSLWLASGASTFVLAAIVLRPNSLTLWLIIAFGSAMIPPLGRLALTPMALDWNRHQ